jgi:iron complex outermembrane receptor protein
VGRSNSNLESLKRRKIAAAGLLLVSLTGAARGQQPARDLTEASLEDLMNIEVTTVSKKEQKLAHAPAAVYVITHEDIRRSGMTSLPDLLRMVPGMQVGQIQGGPWAVSTRGFNDQYSNKLLVLVDGRSVYSPIHAGVTWEAHDTLLEDIDRIEVIRGPGATLWGANAVNGVINIITKAAKDTQGTLVTAGSGDQGQALGAFRYGGSLGASGHFRAFVKYLHGRGLSNAEDRPIIDGESSLGGGFRADWTLSSRDSLTVEAGLLRAHANSEVESFALQPPFKITVEGVERNRSGDLMATWTHRQSSGSVTALRVYLDHESTSEPNLSRSYSNLDVDFQHQLTLSESNGLVWGVGFRESGSRSSGTFSASLRPDPDHPLYSGFVQDQHSFAAGRLSAIFGSKFERNDFTGVEIQPGARLVWTPDNYHTLWAAVSRAVRTPSSIDRNLQTNITFPGPNGAPAMIRLLGDSAVRSEELLAYELGYRWQAKRRFSIDLASSYNVYRHLISSEPRTPFFEPDPKPAHLVIPAYFENRMRGETYGVEIASNWNATERWRLIPGYSWTRLDVRLDPASRDTKSLDAEGKTPRQQLVLRSNLDVSRRLQFDAGVYYTGALPALVVPAYTRVDARLGYRLRPNVEISVAGQNLQGGRHVEFVSVGPYSRASIRRSVFLKLVVGE